jgi:hypothetical protein
MTGFLSIWKSEDLDWESMRYDKAHLPDITDARIYVNGEVATLCDSVWQLC